ncbi:hypothetical protein F5X97DRAFT_39016 [Nemania serpens]|nr:hypothetical protein F5X97DRAFT_39016 [Nemania serpens]
MAMSRRKNLPKFLRFSLMLAAFCPPTAPNPALPPPPPPAPAAAPGICPPPIWEGVPILSTPSRAAERSFSPRLVGSKRAGVAVAAAAAAAWLSPPTRLVAFSSGVRSGLCATSLPAPALGAASRWMPKSSTRCGWSALRTPLSSRIFLKLVSERSPMWMR